MIEDPKIQTEVFPEIFDFCHYNGTILTRQQFSALLSKSLKFSGIEGGQYKAHSFRIGGATALSLAGYSYSKGVCFVLTAFYSRKFQRF
jgi:site-specific recombinase XerD